MTDLWASRAYAASSRPRFLAELMEFIRFPTVSAAPRHAGDLRHCAAWLAAHLRRIGLERVAALPTPGQAVVYGEWLRAPGKPTVLVYGHYDVQPVDPIREWHSPPFEPTLRGEDLFARGASDDKGQLLAHVKAFESYLLSVGRLPVNVKCLFDGEDEIGSPHLADFLTRHRERVGADVVLVSDTAFPAAGRPAITYALRGALSMELEVRGPGRDVHSGVYGGAIHNPLQALCEIIASFHSADRRVAIPGFYGNVREWSRRERQYMAGAGPTDAQLLRDALASQGWGERGFSLHERATIRPALTVTGITGGYQGSGVKAVIPSRARAKLDLRLVPDQRPWEIERLFRRHLARVVPRTVRAAVRTLFSAGPVLVDRGNPAVQAAMSAYRTGFGKAPVLLRRGGSIPAVGLLQQLLGVPTVLMGFGLPDDGIHSPNEKFHLPQFYKGIATSMSFLSELARQRVPEERFA